MLQKVPFPRRPRQKNLEEILDPISGNGGCVVGFMVDMVSYALFFFLWWRSMSFAMVFMVESWQCKLPLAVVLICEN